MGLHALNHSLVGSGLQEIEDALNDYEERIGRRSSGLSKAGLFTSARFSNPALEALERSMSRMKQDIKNYKSVQAGEEVQVPVGLSTRSREGYLYNIHLSSCEFIGWLRQDLLLRCAKLLAGDFSAEALDQTSSAIGTDDRMSIEDAKACAILYRALPWGF